MRNIVYTLMFFGVLFGQTYTEGDYVNDFGANICYNGDGYWSWEEQGLNKVTWVSSFATWWGPCQSEAPIVESIYQTYLDNPNVVIVTAGMDWGQPYSCSGWATDFGQTLPILDDDNGGNIYSLFGVGYIPHNVVIGGDGLVIYSQSGFNQNTMVAMIEDGLANLVLDVDADGILDGDDNCPEVHNVQQEDIDGDGAGDLCDPCNNLIWTGGDMNGDLNISITDILILVDVILGTTESQCGYEAANLNGDDVVNIIDVIRLVQLVIGGTQQQAISFLERSLSYANFMYLMNTGTLPTDKILIWPNPSNSVVNISGKGYTIIYDLMGRKVKEINLNGRYSWNTNDLSSGIYTVVNNKRTTTITLLK